MSISFVQGANNGAFANAVSLSGVAVGNLLIVWGRFFGGTTPTLTDSAGNTWVQGGSFTNGSSKCVMWYCLAASATTTSPVISGAGSFPEIVIEEFNASGGATWTFGSQTNGTGTQSSPTWSAGAQTVSVGDLVLGCFENESTNGVVFGNAGGFTYRSIDAQGNVVITDKVATGTSETPQVNANATASVGWMSANFTATAPVATRRRISFID